MKTKFRGKIGTAKALAVAAVLGLSACGQGHQPSGDEMCKAMNAAEARQTHGASPVVCKAAKARYCTAHDGTYTCRVQMILYSSNPNNFGFGNTMRTVTRTAMIIFKKSDGVWTAHAAR